jgi:rod shape-determining protein MreC
MSKRQHYAAFGLVLLLVWVLLSLPSQAATKLKLACGSVFLPLFGLAGTAQSLAEQVPGNLASRRSLGPQLEALRRENQQLRLVIAQLEEARLENARLRLLLGWQNQARWRLKLARVLGRDTANWWRTLRIDLGTRDGLRADLPVLTAEGLVGRLGEVGYTSSQVVLVGDPNCRVSVLVRETGELGVLSASSAGVLDHRLVDLTHLPRHTALKPGQTIYTSGQGGLYPAGLPVGAVVDSRSVGYGLSTEARVKLAADSSRLRELWVMFP